MPNFILMYFGDPQFDTEEEGKAHQQKWMDWMQGLGDAIVNPGTPMGPAKAVTADSVTDANGTRITGFTIVKADHVDAAIEMAQSSPYLEHGTTINVAETYKM